MPSSAPRSVLLLLAFAFAVLSPACARSRVAPAPSPTVAVVATAVPAREPSPTPEPDLGEGWIELVRRGWESILDYHIAQPEPRPLLAAAWGEVSAEARSRGIDAGSQPALAGEREEMWAAFANSYLALLHASPEDAWQAYRYAALSGMTASLGDCHTFFLPPRRSEVLTDIRTGRGSGGIGVELAPVLPTYVRETISGGPAHKAGVLPGDYLLAVDGRDVTGLGIEVITELLRGEPGSAISVEVRRPSNGSVLNFPLTRDLVHAPVADGRVLPDGSGYIRIRSFTTGPSLRDAVDGLIAGFEAAGVQGWVIDLRDNPGGDSDLELYGRFVGDAVAKRSLLRDGGLEIRDGEGEAYPQRPIAVLVNAGTASVAEIFAAMLQDYGRGRVFGSGTGRCAGFVSLETYPDQSTLGVTIARSLTPRTEQPLWQTGVVPDVTVRRTQADIAANRDPVREAALAWLRTQAP